MLNNLVAWAVTTGLIYLKSDGSPWRPIVHIEDISRAFIAALEAPKERVFNEALNVGCTEHNYRIRDIIRDGEWTGRGYVREDFYDAWERYLPPPPSPEGSATSTTSATNGHDADLTQADRIEEMMKHCGLTREQAEIETAKWAV